MNFGFGSSDWLRKQCKILKPITKHSNAKPKQTQISQQTASSFSFANKSNRKNSVFSLWLKPPLLEDRAFTTHRLPITPVFLFFCFRSSQISQQKRDRSQSNESSNNHFNHSCNVQYYSDVLIVCTDILFPFLIYTYNIYFIIFVKLCNFILLVFLIVLILFILVLILKC